MEQDRPKVEHRSISRQNAMDEYIERFRYAISRRLPGPERSLIPLSGGRDSRHILFELLRAGVKPDRCLTSDGHPSTADRDVLVAASIAKRFGLDHDVVYQPLARIEAEQRKNELLSFSALEHSWYLALGDYMRSQSFSTVYEGIGGDILSAGLFMTAEKTDLFRREKWESLAHILMPEATDVLLDELIHPDLMRRMNRQAAVAVFAKELRNYADSANPTADFYFWNRTRRSIALCPFASCYGVKNVYAPYLDEAVYDLLASLPGEMLIDGTFHTQTIERAFPEYSAIPYAAKTGKRTVGMAYNLRYLRDLFAFVARHPAPLLKCGTAARILRILADKRLKRAPIGFAPLIVYLTQLGRCAETGMPG
ncbi:MAG: hypothetical protein JXN61_02070 [Sedimentisphaerales bacterium]|nr:hypothetical protein [Sedimentisphaerales bacterium]